MARPACSRIKSVFRSQPIIWSTNCLPFLESQGSLPCSQNRIIDPCSESDKPNASPLTVTSYVQNTYIVTLCQRKHSDVCALLGYYAACNDNSLPTFRDNLSVPSWPFKLGR